MYRVWKHVQFGLLVSLCILLFASSSVQAQAMEVQVIVNPSTDLDTMTTEQIRRIFSMRQTLWFNQQAIKVYVLDSHHETHLKFCTKTLGLFPYQLDRIWNKLVYSGLGEEPIKVKSEQQMLESVSQQPGAIGYITNQFITDDVKIIKVRQD